MYNVQYFCDIKNPTPSIDQSVDKEVGRAGSKRRTPSFISLVMTSLDFLNKASNSSVQENFVEGFGRCLKGFICFVIEKAHKSSMSEEMLSL